MRNLLFVISGPSGVGKGTLVDRVLELDDSLVESVSCTTRSPRAGEVHGREYFFISEEEFLSRIEQGDFLEADKHFGNYYGTPLSFVKQQLEEKSVILEIDVVGGLNCKKLLPDKTVLIFIQPPSMEVLFARLKGRESETEQQREDRLRRVEYEYSQREHYDHIIVNDDLQTATEELLAVIRKEKQA